MEKQKFISYEVKPILEVCDFEKGTEPGSKSYNREGLGIPFIRVGNIGAQIQEQIYTTSENIKLCNKEDILITLDGTPGIVIRGIEGAYASGIRKVIVKDPNILLRDFVYYFLQTDYVQKIIEQHSTGITIQHASKALKYIEIPIPPLEIQQKIVSILDTIQKAVEIHERIIEKTKELKKSLMADLFKYGGPSFRKGRKLKKTEIGEIPEDWEVVRLGEDLFEIKLGGTPKTSIIRYWNGEIPWVTPNDLSNLTSPYIEKTQRSISEEGLKSGSTLLPQGSIILSTRAPIGYVAILRNPMAFNQGCKGIIIRAPERVLNLFAYYFLLTKSKILYELGSGSTFRELSTGDLKNFKIPLPSLPEQQEIADILSTIDQKIEIEEKKKRLYEELFKTVLNKIMNQEIDVEDIEI